MVRVGGSQFSKLKRALRRKERRRLDIRPRALSCHAPIPGMAKGTGFFVSGWHVGTGHYEGCSAKFLAWPYFLTLEPWLKSLYGGFGLF
jgi:hypothetical protein